MKDRIREIMESEDYTPARFADTLDIGRAIISHILNGRNNPSLDVISRILEAFPTINPDWLLFGTGSMYRGEVNSNNLGGTALQPPSNSGERVSHDLFSQPELFKEETKKEDITQKNLHIRQTQEPTTIPSPKSESSPNQNTSLAQSGSVTTEIIQERVIYKDIPAKKITQIIIYYDDNTFEVFNR